jgi:hypothetical protein
MDPFFESFHSKLNLKILTVITVYFVKTKRASLNTRPGGFSNSE